MIRGITNWGPFLLTKRKVRSQVLHDSGHHFIIRFDCSPATQRLVHKTTAVDPRMIRCGVVKLGDTLREIADVPGKVPWQRSMVTEFNDANKYRMVSWRPTPEEMEEGEDG